jgi:hypothetical protein
MLTRRGFAGFASCAICGICRVGSVGPRYAACDLVNGFGEVGLDHYLLQRRAIAGTTPLRPLPNRPTQVLMVHSARKSRTSCVKACGLSTCTE